MVSDSFKNRLSVRSFWGEGAEKNLLPDQNLTRELIPRIFGYPKNCATSGHHFHGFSLREKRETDLPEFLATAISRSEIASAPSKHE